MGKMMSETKVIHIRNKNKYPEEKLVYIGRPSKYENPFKLQNKYDDFEREVVVEKFRKLFYDKIESNSTFLNDILSLRGKILYCYCKPKQCHGDIIIEFLNNKLEKK